MHRFLAALLLAGLAATAFADDKKEKPEPSLKVGDAAPALKADKWLQGTEIKEFASGKIYVVEFWATWCGPCIMMMPHMSEMQTQYRDKGVTFIGFSAKDPNNSQEKVSAFVEKRGPKLGYTFAYGDNRDTYDCWMKAAGRGGIPCSYVVDQKGKIAYIGHPMFLDVVLPKVVDGTWSGADSVAEIDKIEKDVDGVFETFRKPDAEAALKAITSFEKKYPALAHVPYFVAPKIGYLIKTKKIDEAKKFATAVMDKAIKQEDPTGLRSVIGGLSEAKDHKELIELSLKAALAALKFAGDKDLRSLIAVADAYVAAGDKTKGHEYGAKAVDVALAAQKKAGDKDIGSFIAVADAYLAAGDRAKAREYGAKAVDAADNPRTKQAVERFVKKYEDEKKEDK